MPKPDPTNSIGRMRMKSSLISPLSLGLLSVLLCPLAQAQKADGAAFARPLNLSTTTAIAAKSSVVLPEAPAVADPSSVSSTDQPSGTEAPVSIKGFPKRVLFDELHVLSSPARVRKSDLRWLLPIAAAAAVSFGTDTKTMTDVVSHNPSFNQSSGTASDVLRGSFIGLPVGLFAVGEAAHNERARETGLLAGEAMLDAYLFGELVKVATFRERPSLDNARGAFYQRSAGLDSSFPSGHTTVAWSSAAVLAEEYPSRWKQIGIYTFATGVSLTRVMAQQHFPSDVLIGSAAGWLIGHYVYRAHHRHPRSY